MEWRNIRSGRRWSLSRSRLAWVRSGRGKFMETVLTHWGSLTYDQLKDYDKLVLIPRGGKVSTT